MALAVLLVVLLLLPLAALATFTPWPVEATVVLASLAAAVVAHLAAADAFLSMCAFVGVSSGSFTLLTAGRVYGSVAALRRERERRRRRRPVQASRPLPARARDAA